MSLGRATPMALRPLPQSAYLAAKTVAKALKVL
jgi:hypothetical protein